MPPKTKITKEDILAAAVQITREEGADALSARALANRLSCSTQPIFWNYPNMDALRRAVLDEAYALYVKRTFDAMDSGRYVPYKASGMAYIEFAVEEPQLFKLLYMRDRRGEERIDDTAESEQIVGVIMQNTGLNSKYAHLLHTELWAVVHGLAVMCATGFGEYDEKRVGDTLTDIYLGVLSRFQEIQRSETND